MDMRLEQTSFEAEIPCGSCKTRFTVEGDVTLPGSLRETTNILHASAMAVVESAEASQDRATIAGRVIFCVLYTQGDHGTPESIEAAADFTHLCDMPGAVPRSAVDAWAQAEHVTASVQNGRVSMKAVLSLCARAVCTQTAEALSAAKGDSVQQKTDQITLRRKTASGSADTLLREEFSLPADLAVTETLAAWADVQMLDATGGQGRIGLSGEVTLTVAHASSQPGRPLIMTRHTIPVGESVEVAGDGGDMLRGRIRVKDVAVASQDLGDGERTLRAEVLLGMNAWAEREEIVAVLADAYTTSGEALRLNRAPIYQAILYMSEEDQRKLPPMPGIRLTSWTLGGADLIPATGGKAAGIAKVLQHYGIDKSETMAFGDGQNDVDMFRAVGTAVAMGNACREAKEAAHHITDSVDEDGIYNALKHFGIL